jgi:hypothetical protein
MITCEEIAVGADQDFDAFLREWAEEYIGRAVSNPS